MTLYLVAGYRGSGKDTLCQQFNRQSPHPFDWLVYGDCHDTTPLFVRPVQRLSFAQTLKSEVLASLGVPADFDSEPYKDKAVSSLLAVFGLSTTDTRTLRDLFIQHGLDMRTQDINYWCKRALSNMEPGVDYMITDWRFANEYLYACQLCHQLRRRVVTVRVFNARMPIPPPEVESEHDVDTVPTHYVLFRQTLPSEVVAVFNQYSDYVPVTCVWS